MEPRSRDSWKGFPRFSLPSPMQVARRVSTERAPNQSAGAYLSALSLYKDPPTDHLSVSQFEEYAFDRLRLLSTIEIARAKGLKAKQLDDTVRKAVNEFMPTTPTGIVKDRYSHFILRLAYCRSDDLRRWFLQNELELFRWRFVSNPPEDRTSWLAKNGLKYEAISRDELDQVREHLHQALAARRDLEPFALERLEHYKVPFEEVIDLVRQRKVFLREGWAYVPEADLVSIVSNQVRSQWSRQLATMARQWPALREEESERLAAFLEGLASQYVGEDYSRPTTNGAKVSLGELPGIAPRSFPLCMHNMHSKLHETHHLKHSARHQLGLFLKGIRLTVEESLAYWRAQFTKKIPADKFNKEYAYNIRYNYGLEGKRQDWSAFSCGKIINSPGANASAGEHHGCPFRNFDEGQLRAQLQLMQVTGSDANFILEKVRGHHYQVACGKYFEAKHKGTTLIERELGGIEHPNQYFEESMKFYKPQVEGDVNSSQSGASPSKETESA